MATQVRAGLHGTVAQSTSNILQGSASFNSYETYQYLEWGSLWEHGNRRTWTISAWAKIVPSNISNINHRMWFSADAGAAADATRFITCFGDASDQLQLDLGSASIRYSSSRYRDPE